MWTAVDIYRLGVGWAVLGWDGWLDPKPVGCVSAKGASNSLKRLQPGSIGLDELDAWNCHRSYINGGTVS